MKRPIYPVTYLLFALLLMAAVHLFLPIAHWLPAPYACESYQRHNMRVRRWL